MMSTKMQRGESWSVRSDDEPERFLLEASRLFNSSMDISVVLERIVTTISTILGDLSAILLVQDIEGLPDAGVVHLEDEVKREPFMRLLREVPLRLGQGYIGGSVARGEPLIMSSSLLSTISEPGRRYIALLDPKSVLVVPLRVRDVTLGALVTVATREGRDFDDRDIAYSTQIAAHAAIAIDNARVYKLLQRQEAELRRLLAEQIKVQEEERKRIALDVHDAIIQSLIAALQRVRDRAAMSEPEGADTVERLLRSSIDDLRFLVNRLRPLTLDTFGLAPAIEAELQEFERRELVITRLEISGKPRDLDDTSEIALFRILQEALANVRRHAHASSVAVTLAFERHEVTMTIEDDGIGVRSGPTPTFGISGMKERAALAGGHFSIGPRGRSTGTLIVVRLPAEATEATP